MIIDRKSVIVALDLLKPYENNARTHSDEQVAEIAASVKEFGWTTPLLVSRETVPGSDEFIYRIIAGHGRLKAATLLGMTGVPCIDCTGLSPAQLRALVLADNKIALNAGWDKKLLKSELLDLPDNLLNLTGFDAIELNALIGRVIPIVGEDDSPSTPGAAVTVPGDCWLLGSHRVKCGDATSATDTADVLIGAIPNLMVTDPPYGVEYDAEFRNDIRRADGSRVGARAVGKVMNDDRADWREAWALFPGKIAYVWCASMFNDVVIASLEACDFKRRAQIIWAKNQLAIGRGDYHWQHEPCWYAVKGTGNWTGDRSQSTLWEIDKPSKSETGHSTQKPVECMRRPMQNNSLPGDIVYDPFLGSGTSIIAAESCGRVCYGLELNPAYVDVIVRRWQEFSGKKAVHAATAALFDAYLNDQQKEGAAS